MSTNQYQAPTRHATGVAYAKYKADPPASRASFVSSFEDPRPMRLAKKRPYADYIRGVGGGGPSDPPVNRKTERTTRRFEIDGLQNITAGNAAPATMAVTETRPSPAPAPKPKAGGSDTF